MLISEVTKNNIQQKKKKLDQLTAYLKEEYVGLDVIIDNIINSIMPFYLFPESLKRPIVINLWGLTGGGKTSMVEKIVDFLKLNNSFLKFDIGEYSSDGKSLRTELSQKTKKLNSQSNILLFDEFQLGRTIDDMGKEIDKNKLRPLWELLDSGVLYVQNFEKLTALFQIIERYKKLQTLNVQVSPDGYVINSELFNQIFIDYHNRPIDFKTSYYVKSNGEKQEISSNDSMAYSSSDTYFFNDPFILKYNDFETLYSIDPLYFDGVKNFTYHKNKFIGKSITDIINMLETFMENVSILEKKDYSKSLIFCLGNLDEVYTMAHNINPDADADIFYEHSLKITLPQVKKALSSRFRMEQIARLGNNHLIYPSIKKKSYEQIISKFLTSTSNELCEKFEIDFKFDKTVNEILYKEGVFPTQGLRPLLSTFSTMINSYISTILTELTFVMLDVNVINWKYENYKYIIEASNGHKEHQLSYNVECNLEKLRAADNSEIQSLVAVHESGHALISCIKHQLVPIEVLSKTADISEGLCKFNYEDIIETKDFLYKKLMVLLGGLESEKLIFGNELACTGSVSDLKKATDIAFNIVKRYGLDNNPYMISAVNDQDMNGSYVLDNQCEKRVIKLLKKAQKEVKKTLLENKEHLLRLSKYLANNPKISNNQIKDMLSDLNIEWKNPNNYYGFREKLSTSC